jgi:hypothetical protein
MQGGGCMYRLSAYVTRLRETATRIPSSDIYAIFISSVGTFLIIAPAIKMSSLIHPIITVVGL